MPVLPSVVFRTPDGALHTVHSGGLIGRLPTAACRVHDPRVSEAHALVSLRGRTLKLLGLRHALGVRGRWIAEVELEEGLCVLLAEELEIRVASVGGLDGPLLALSGLGEAAVELDQPELSLFLDPPGATAGWKREAAGWVWRTDEVWTFQAQGQTARTFGAGDALDLGPSLLTVVEVPLAREATVGAGHLHPPLVLDILEEHTEVWVQGRGQSVKLRQNAHEILRAVAMATSDGKPVGWQKIAVKVWGEKRGTEDNWYTSTSRLKKQFKELGLPNLLDVEQGLVALALRPGVDQLKVYWRLGAGDGPRSALNTGL